MKVLLELRPAFDGHSGIPQETRLLFRGLACDSSVRVSGLIQSSNLTLEAGIPVRDGVLRAGCSEDEKIDRLSRVVVSLQQEPPTTLRARARRLVLRIAGPALSVLGSLFGRDVPLSGFEPQRFEDFLWRSLFARSLQASDRHTVTRAEFRILRWPWSSLHAIGVATSWLGRALYPRLDTTGIDVVIAETPFPSRVSTPTRLIVRYHDAIPLLMPHTIKNRRHHRSTHLQALLRNAADGAWFACVSDSTRKDLLSILPKLAGRAVTIPNMISDHFFSEASPARLVPEIVWSRKNRQTIHAGGAQVQESDLLGGALSYLLMVGTIEPRKNHSMLLDAWSRLRLRGWSNLNLIVVGSPGWDHDAILDRFSPWLERGGVHLLVDVPADELRVLYRHAAVTVCPSFGEGFDFPGVEAMRCGGVVAASDIAVHRDIFADACEFFDPYAVDQAVEVLESLLGPEAGPRRAALVEAGERLSARYLPERVMPKWHEFLQAVVAA